MHEPPLHQQADRAAIVALIRAHPLGLLISHGPSGLLANSIPFLIEGDKLLAHVARANPQWRDLQQTDETLVVFQGPQHYISPSWYATKRETHKVVPTWNYLIAQVRGRPRVTDDAPWLRAQIKALTASQEGARAAPWQVSDAPEDFIAMQMRAIVGVEIEITDIKGKWKASQNRSEADRAGVVVGLNEDGDAAALAMASVVEAL